MSKPKITAVIPTCRVNAIHNFLDKWSPYPWDETIIVVDAPGSFPLDQFDVVQYNHKSIDEYHSSYIFSKGDSAIRVFGFLMAAIRGADYIVTLDDDCLPYTTPSDFMTGHIRNLNGIVPLCASSVPGMRVRGLPYLSTSSFIGNVALSVGLWAGCPDLDGITLVTQNRIEDFEPPRGVRLVNPCQYIPVCGMNMAFSCEILPAMYFPKMGQDSPYGRFEDIWAGLIVQNVLQAHKYHITVGEPFVRHSKLSDPYKSLVKESPGYRLNEWLWRALYSFEVEYKFRGKITDTTEALGRALQSGNGINMTHCPDIDYVTTMGQYLIDWSKMANVVLTGRER